MNIYRHRFEAQCPVNGKRILYRMELKTLRTVTIEKIIHACSGRCILHEDLADKLYQQFGGFQIIRAHHHGVDIETHRGTL